MGEFLTKYGVLFLTVFCQSIYLTRLFTRLEDRVSNQEERLKRLERLQDWRMKGK